MAEDFSSKNKSDSYQEKLTLSIGRRQMWRAISAAALGNAVEWYDAAVYLYIAGTIGKVFFSQEKESVQLINSFALFAIAFLIRPIGGLILGPLSDRIGRQKVLSFTILLMGGATFGIGLIPSYSVIGSWGIILLLLCRLIQGFSTGGEYGGATTFIAEYAPDNRRGFYGAWLEVGTLGGFTLGAGVVTALMGYLGHDAMENWGWRVPFLVAAPLSLIGFYLRKRLEETPAFIELEKHAKSVVSLAAPNQMRQTVGGQWKQLLECAGLVIVFNVGYYLVLTYLPAYLNTEVGLDESAGLTLTLVIMTGMMMVNPMIGLLSDHIGRKQVLFIGCIGFILFSVPAFLLMQAGGALLIFGVVLLCAIFTCFTGVIPSTLPALFPTSVRNGSLAISYNVAVSLFGGTTPLIVTTLIRATGNRLMPAYWMMLAATVGVIAVWRIKESAGQPLPGSSAMIATSDLDAGKPPEIAAITEVR